MDKKKKILIWTLVGIIATVVILTVVFAFVNNPYCKMGLAFMWLGILLGVGAGVVCHMLKVLPEEEELAKLLAQYTSPAAVKEEVPVAEEAEEKVPERRQPAKRKAKK